MSHYEKILSKMPLDANFVVLGDSQAQGWPPDLLKSISPSSVIFNYGVAGDRTQTVLWQMRTPKVQQLKPKLVLLVLGTNNLGANDQPCAIAKAMGEVVFAINQTWNTPRILLIEIAPRGLNFLYRNEDRLQTHLEIRRSLAEFHNVTFINIDQVIAACPTTDGCNTLRPDLLHFTRTGYEAATQVVKRSE
jgi:lysophospholipase L1-like esterase